MTNLWPWIAVAALGAVHGLSPATGWMFAAACGVGERRGAQEAQVLRALMPIAVGHGASVAAVAFAFAQGMAMDRTLVQGVAGILLVGAALYRWLHKVGPLQFVGTKTGHVGIALWSFLMATAHGAGLMLVPALVPLCLSDNPAREITASGSLLLALGAVGVHSAAMLVVTGLIASGVCRGIAMYPRLRRADTLRRTWTAALAVTGVLLVALR